MAQPTPKPFHYFFSPYERYQMSPYDPVLKKKILIQFVGNRFATNDEHLVEIMRAYPKFSIDYNETTRLVPITPVSSVMVSTGNAVPIDAAVLNEAVRRSAEFAGMGAPVSEVEAADGDLTRKEAIKKAVDFNLPGDPIPGDHNDRSYSPGTSIGTVKVGGAQ